MTGVYKAINRVQAALAKDGISKDRRNQQQGYNFRGIDDVYNALSPLLAEHGLCILPRILSREIQERATAKGGVMFYVTVEAEFDFVCAEDGTQHVVRTYGEAMDTGDKATNKAMSAAYKYAAFQAFAIPTEGDNDADAHTPVTVPRVSPTQGVWDSLSEQEQSAIQLVAQTVCEYMEQDDVVGAYDYIERKAYNAEQKTGLWTRLDSKTRAALKRENENRGRQ